MMDMPAPNDTAKDQNQGQVMTEINIQDQDASAGPPPPSGLTQNVKIACVEVHIDT